MSHKMEMKLIVASDFSCARRLNRHNN